MVGYSVGLLHEAALFIHDVNEFLLDARSRSTGHERPVTTSERLPVVSLRAEAVSFAYGNATTATLENVSLTLRAGHVTAFVGENGSGKTTMAKSCRGCTARRAASFGGTEATETASGSSVATISARCEAQRHWCRRTSTALSGQSPPRACCVW